MTRLVKNDVEMIGRELSGYDTELTRKTGMTMGQIAAATAGITQEEFIERTSSCLAAVIPVTAGEGIIECFVQSVCSILTHLGCRGYITGDTDVSGIAEAITTGADLLFMADDLHFVAVNMHTEAVIDNGEATGRGYVAALNGMAGGLKGKQALVLGAGPVGCGALAMLKKIGAQPAVFDIDTDKTRQTCKNGVIIEHNLKDALSKYRYIVDATPQAAFIEYSNIHPDTMMALPGIPIGLTDEAYALLQDRVIHDPLQIGVAAMLALAVGKVTKS